MDRRRRTHHWVAMITATTLVAASAVLADRTHAQQAFALESVREQLEGRIVAVPLPDPAERQAERELALTRAMNDQALLHALRSRPAPPPAPARPGVLDGGPPALAVFTPQPAALDSLVDSAVVAPGLLHTVHHVPTPGGRAVVNVLRFHPGDPRLTVRPEPAGGAIGGRESVLATVRRLADDGAVAAVNGGFWLTSPSGDPEGLLVRDGRLVSDPITRWFTAPRSAFAVDGDGGGTVGYPSLRVELWGSNGERLGIAFLNRAPEDEVFDLVLLDERFGAATGTEPGGFEVALDGPDLEFDTTSTYRVVGWTSDGDAPIGAGQLVVSARGAKAEALRRITESAEGGRITLHVESDPWWADARQALTGGPLLVRQDVVLESGVWRAEGFAPSHTDVRHPRTAVGFTPAGEMLLVTIDGRQRGSVGMTARETAELLVALGARDAIMMDGGGSSQMAAVDRLVNSPCCDSPVRAVATSIVVYANG